jgi:hypothetical protein
MVGAVLIRAHARAGLSAPGRTESGVHSSGFITREVNGAGARSAVNLHAACEVAEAGSGLRCG